MASTEAPPPIPFVDLAAQYRRIKADVDRRIHAVLDHGRFILGPEVDELERALAARAGCRHAIACASGTDALLMALMADGVGAGDAVFLPAFTFTATAEVVLMAGATPVFVDVDARTFNVDPAHLAHMADETVRQGRLRPRMVIAVDLFGQPADYPALDAIARAHGMTVLADAAQSFGGALGNRPVGSLAPVTATSFYPAKPLGAYGDGGAVFCDDDTTAAVLRSIRAHGQGEDRYDIVRLGINGRLDTLQAAILLAKLEVFDDEQAARERLARFYDGALAGVAEIPARVPDSRSAWAQYSILLDDRDRVAVGLRAAGVPTAIYYPLPMHLQPAYRRHGLGEGSLPVAEALCGRILSLPMHAYLADATAERIVTAFLLALRSS